MPIASQCNLTIHVNVPKEYRRNAAAHRCSAQGSGGAGQRLGGPAPHAFGSPCCECRQAFVAGTNSFFCLFLCCKYIGSQVFSSAPPKSDPEHRLAAAAAALDKASAEMRGIHAHHALAHTVYVLNFRRTRLILELASLFPIEHRQVRSVCRAVCVVCVCFLITK